MAHPKVKIISHPDDDHTPLHYERLVKGALEYGTALEINNSSLIKKDIRLNCYENYRTMPVVSSDAHDPSGVGRFDLAIDLLEEIGFPESLVLNTDEQKLLEFLLAE